MCLKLSSKCYFCHCKKEIGIEYYYDHRVNLTMNYVS